MIAIAALLVIMTCQPVAGSTQDACSYAEPQTWVYVTDKDLKECADLAQEKNEFYAFLRARKLNGKVYQTARCEVVNMVEDAIPARTALQSYPNSMQSEREVTDRWIF